MKKIILLMALVAANASADTYVDGYTRRDGIYVPGHYKTDQNSTKIDNYSTKGNVNPYTAEKGYVDPYKQQQYEAPKSTYGTHCRYNSRGEYVCR
jgi:hypothetical protein